MSYNESSADPLSHFSRTDAADNSHRTKLTSTSILQKYADTMSRIGASASDLIADSLSFTDPLLSRNPHFFSGGGVGIKQSERTEVYAEKNQTPQKNPFLSDDTQNNSLLRINQNPIPSPNRNQKQSSFDAGMNPFDLNPSNNPLSSDKQELGLGILTCGESLIENHMSQVPAEQLDVDELDDFKYLTGEHKILSLLDARIQLSPGRLLAGTLILTSYRLAFVPAPTHLAAKAALSPSLYSFLNLPLGSIDRIEKEKRSKDSRSNSITVVISCKDLRQQRITLQTNGLSEYILEKSIQMIAAQAFPNDKALFFAFTHSLPSEPLCLSLVEPYDAVKEFSRLGMLDVISHTGDQSLWRISIANNEYRLCNTYPKVIVVPRKISDDDLVGISNFRSGHRLPVMCWGDKDTGATMWRSSQPKAGVSGSCSVDEKMLDLIAQSCVYKKTPMGGLKVTGDPLLYIIDCRAKTSALANRASGAGYESQNNYPNTRIDFCNIGNIHVMRESLKGLTATLLSCTPMGNDVSFSKQIEDSGWLTHIRLVLKCALDTAVLIQKGLPVLVHCSHGWDRTAQICSLSQLLLDPYYRTMDGFRVLVEKEWCSFGHPFPLRSANGQDRANRQEDQISPIFLQFLDCTYQIVNQNPHYFEFNFRYLLTLSDHIHSGRFGTFLFGCDMERDTHHADQRCVNVWTYLHYNRMSFLNPLYMDPNLPNTPTTHSLLPPLSQLLRNVTLWTDYYFRYCSLPSIIQAPLPLTKYLHQNGVTLPTYTLTPPNANKNLAPETSIPKTPSPKDLTPKDPETPPGPFFIPIVLNPIFAPSVQSPFSCPDLELPAMVTSTDFWEAAYRREIEKKNEENKSLESSMKMNIFDEIKNNSPNPNGKDKEQGEGLHVPYESSQGIIDRMVALLIEKGTTVDEIREIYPGWNMDGSVGGIEGESDGIYDNDNDVKESDNDGSIDNNDNGNDNINSIQDFYSIINNGKLNNDNNGNDSNNDTNSISSKDGKDDIKSYNEDDTIYDVNDDDDDDNDTDENPSADYNPNPIPNPVPKSNLNHNLNFSLSYKSNPNLNPFDKLQKDNQDDLTTHNIDDRSRDSSPSSSSGPSSNFCPSPSANDYDMNNNGRGSHSSSSTSPNTSPNPHWSSQTAKLLDSLTVADNEGTGKKKDNSLFGSSNGKDDEETKFEEFL